MICNALKALITTAADDKFGHIFPNFRKKNKVLYFMRMTILITFIPYLLSLKKQQNLKLSSAANNRWRFLG